jgi:hypothetical protein
MPGVFMPSRGVHGARVGEKVRERREHRVIKPSTVLMLRSTRIRYELLQTSPTWKDWDRRSQYRQDQDLHRLSVLRRIDVAHDEDKNTVYQSGVQYYEDPVEDWD